MVISLTTTEKRKQEGGKTCSIVNGGFVLDAALRRLVVGSTLVLHIPLLGCIFIRMMMIFGEEVKG
jgi:hypothetical protein